MTYNTALQSDAWQTFLDRLVTCSNSRSGLLVFQNADNHAIGHTVKSGLDDSLRKPDRCTYLARNAWKCGVNPPPHGQVYPELARAARQEFQHPPSLPRATKE